MQPCDSFSDLGGHSIAAARLLSRLRHVFHAELTIRDIFEAPLAALLSTRLDIPREPVSGAEYSTRLPLRVDGPLDPLFCVHPGIGLSWTYSALLRHLEAGRPVYGLQSPAFISGRTPEGIPQRGRSTSIRSWHSSHAARSISSAGRTVAWWRKPSRRSCAAMGIRSDSSACLTPTRTAQTPALAAGAGQERDIRSTARVSWLCGRCWRCHIQRIGRTTPLG